MKKLVFPFALLLVVVLAGCSPKYSIVVSDYDRFVTDAELMIPQIMDPSLDEPTKNIIKEWLEQGRRNVEKAKEGL